ncbi:hypothetical protein BJY04DRAFT_217655 [Aspergillus karnatakaensis]|uniref:protein dscB n=1 Tax=Aspergillus karnatakaensis TaxID=1810916 RepID=UPI003CCDD327
MLTSGLTHTPLTKFLLIYTITASIALSIFDLKHLPALTVTPHLFPYGQFWRCAIWQVAGFVNSTEALFAALLVYHLRVIERGWGSIKLATFILTTLPYTTLLPPLVLALLVKPLSLGKINYLPSGPTATIFALLAQYHASIPSTYRYTISTSASGPSPTPSTISGTTPTSSPSTPSQTPQNHPQPSTSSKKSLTLSLSDKSTTYLIALQLALSQFPHMLTPSVLGWIVGVAWRADVLPFLSGSQGSKGWRVPGWILGLSDENRARNGSGNGSGSGERGFEGLRRRLESEAVAAGAGTGAATGSSSAGASGEAGESGSASGSSRQRVPRGD